jgi:hypothetical protein
LTSIFRHYVELPTKCPGEKPRRWGAPDKKCHVARPTALVVRSVRPARYLTVTWERLAKVCDNPRPVAAPANAVSDLEQTRQKRICWGSPARSSWLETATAEQASKRPSAVLAEGAWIGGAGNSFILRFLVKADRERPARILRGESSVTAGAGSGGWHWPFDCIVTAHPASIEALSERRLNLSQGGSEKER